MNPRAVQDQQRRYHQSCDAHAYSTVTALVLDCVSVVLVVKATAQNVNDPKKTAHAKDVDGAASIATLSFMADPRQSRELKRDGYYGIVYSI